MKDRKLQVFVSSTYWDLKEERQAAVEAILTAGHIPAGMELFTAGDETQMEVIRRWIDDSDIYLLILGGRYGSIEPTSEKSYTHLEYEYAIQRGKPFFAVVMNEEALELKVFSSKSTAIKESENPSKYKEFKSVVTSRMVKFWSNEDQIKLAIYETLKEFSYRKDLIGWVRADQIADLGLIAEEMAKLSNENEQLRVRLRSMETSSVGEPRYVGLTLEEMRRLLDNERAILHDRDISLLEYLSEFGENFSFGKVINTVNWNAMHRDSSFRLAQLGILKYVDSRHYFTEDGQKFFVRQILNPT